MTKQQIIIEYLRELQNELIDNAITENNIGEDYIYDYTEFDSRIGVIDEMIDILEDLER